MNKNIDESILSSQPDIEIYVKDLEATELMTWLELHFEVSSVIEEQSIRDLKNPVEISLLNQGHQIGLMITPNAAGKRYTSLWFKSASTPWEDDKACALDYLAHADSEVRCSAAGWTESEEEYSEEWLCITRAGEKRIKWA